MIHIQTVLGPVAPEEAGRILHHEHLLSLTPGPWLSGGRHDCDQIAPRSGVDPTDLVAANDQVERAVGALSRLRDVGIGTVVDLSPYGVVGRDDDGGNVVLLQEVSRRTGLHIVAGSSVYLESLSPRWTVEADLDQMTQRFIADATLGIAGTEVRIGILGEQATGLGVISPHEEKCLRAAARAHVATGLALSTHTTHGTMALEQLELLREEGADLERVLIGHMDTRPDFDYVRRVADSGVHIAFDTVGKQFWDFRVGPLPTRMPEGEFTKDAYFRADVTRAERIARLVADGHEDQLLLAQDLTGSEVYLNPDTHGQWGYTYLSGPFTGLLREHGVTEAQVDKMLRANPLKLLTLTS
jgi:predicted metal-dependent phosphotriesterase family hydrolase